MDTKSVRLFVLAADKLNISAAGRELGMAPAVASSRLAKLEKLLGADLLRRSTRNVTLSLEGAEFLPFAREILAQEDAANAALGRGSSMPTGTLRFAASSTFAQLYIAPLLPEFLHLHPGIRLDLRLTDAQVPLIEGSFKDNVTRLLIGANGEPAEFNPKQAGCRRMVDDGLSQKVATIAGAGISINSLWSVHRELQDGTLVRVLPQYTADDHSVLWLVYPKSNVLTAKVRVFIDFLLCRIGTSPVWETHEDLQRRLSLDD